MIDLVQPDMSEEREQKRKFQNSNVTGLLGGGRPAAGSSLAGARFALLKVRSSSSALAAALAAALQHSSTAATALACGTSACDRS